MITREMVIERERRIMQAIFNRQHGIETPDISFKNHVVDARQLPLGSLDSKRKKSE